MLVKVGDFAADGDRASGDFNVQHGGVGDPAGDQQDADAARQFIVGLPADWTIGPCRGRWASFRDHESTFPKRMAEKALTK
jgi:hypothetical protein